LDKLEKEVQTPIFIFQPLQTTVKLLTEVSYNHHLLHRNLPITAKIFKLKQSSLRIKVSFEFIKVSEYLKVRPQNGWRRPNFFKIRKPKSSFGQCKKFRNIPRKSLLSQYALKSVPKPVFSTTASRFDKIELKPVVAGSAYLISWLEERLR
jgi:hypothetical protein